MKARTGDVLRAAVAEVLEITRWRTQRDRVPAGEKQIRRAGPLRALTGFGDDVLPSTRDVVQSRKRLAPMRVAAALSRPRGRNVVTIPGVRAVIADGSRAHQR